jgi:hypothetical protein
VTILRDMLDDFHGLVGHLATYAPDNIPAHMSSNYFQLRDWLFEIWPRIKPRLKRDLDKVEIIDRHLTEGFAIIDAYQAALDRGEKPDPAIREKGRNEFWAIYNSEPSKLR